MPYTVKSTEKLRKPGADSETKALLYLMSFCEYSEQVHYFVVDFFNDVTGMNQFANKLWDVQSKADTNVSPKALGREMVTLFKNFCSSFEFSAFILFVGGVVDSINYDRQKGYSTYSEQTPKIAAKIKSGLIEEAEAKTYISKEDITDKNVTDFLDKVIIVVDDKVKTEYVRAIVRANPRVVRDDSVLIGIFNEIRDKQSTMKNQMVVENLVIETCSEALDYYRHLTCNEIKMLVLSRLINRNPYDKHMPQPFFEEFNHIPHEKRTDVLDNCNLAISMALFNKNNGENFWNLFCAICSVIEEHPDFNVSQLANCIDPTIVSLCSEFDFISLKYFIAIVKEGIQ